MNINYDQPLGTIDKETQRHLTLTKAYPQRHFLCDSCGVEYQSATFYSLAYHESEFPSARVYCENCLKSTPAGRQRVQLMNQKTMPNINKLSKKKQIKKTKKLTNLPVPTKSKKTKSSPIEYYNCLLTKAQNDWLDPVTGKKKKITACCKDCRTNAPALNRVREQEISKLIVSYHQVGECLSKLLKPIK